MKYTRTIAGIAIIIAIFFGFSACDNETTSNAAAPNPAKKTVNPFEGIWHGYDQDSSKIHLAIVGSDWTMTWPDAPVQEPESGTYKYNKDGAVIIDTEGYAMGTATVSNRAMIVFITGYGRVVFAKAVGTVTFDANGGSGTAQAPITVDSGSSITLPKGNGLSKDGYAFGGWNTEPSGAGNNYNAGSSYTVYEDITLYAKWNIIPVTAITNVPSSAFMQTPLALGGTVSPNNATNKTIVWSVSNAGTTGASISGNTLNTARDGTVTVTATIADGTAQGVDYVQDFTITVHFVFVPVLNITNVPTSVTAKTSLTLSGAVSPGNATNQTIAWSVKNAGKTGASIESDGDTLYTTSDGTVTVTATIANGTAQGTNYAKDFTITVNPFVSVSNITGVPTWVVMGTPRTLSGAVSPNNATNQTIAWSVSDAGTTGASISGNVLNTTSAGTVTVTATIAGGGATETDDYTQNFEIAVMDPNEPHDTSFTITYDQIADLPEISGPTIYLIAGAGKTTSQTITLANPAQYDAGSIKWYYNGQQLTASGTNGGTLTISTSTYNQLGKYFVTVEVKKGGMLYSRAITFTVAP